MYVVHCINNEGEEFSILKDNDHKVKKKKKKKKKTIFKTMHLKHSVPLERLRKRHVQKLF